MTTGALIHHVLKLAVIEVGLEAACGPAKVDWLVVKGICDWGDGHKNTPSKDDDQRTAARNAMTVVKALLSAAPLAPPPDPPRLPVPAQPPNAVCQPPCAGEMGMGDLNGIACQQLSTSATGRATTLDTLLPDNHRTAAAGEEVLPYLRQWLHNPDAPRLFALLGEYGMGKTITCQLLARELDVPFIELSRAIEALAGCSVREIHDLYGTNAYRRYERRALEETIQIHSEVVIATPGGIVSDPATFNELLARCTTVWLRAAPEEHMGRVVAQGDMRPMAASKEAMDDLKRILDGRAAFYSKAEITVDTSGQTPEQSLQALSASVRKAMARAA